MQKVTGNVWTDTTIRGCNPSMVITRSGVVVIDTPQLPTKAVALREEAESHGEIHYVINTEHHVDHIFGNYYFRGAGDIVHHQGVADNFMEVTPSLDSFDYALEAIPSDDPEAQDLGLVPDRETYFADPGRATIRFTGDLTLTVADHTFNLLHTPGHTPGQIAVHVPEEGVVFTGDTIFSGCQTWLMGSNVTEWLTALDRIAQLDDVEWVVPGHGEVVTMQYLARQRANLLDWVTAVADAVARGWTREETVARVNFAERYPVDVGQGYMMNHIQTLNAGSLWDKITAGRPA
jgi:cyclase